MPRRRPNVRVIFKSLGARKVTVTITNAEKVPVYCLAWAAHKAKAPGSTSEGPASLSGTAGVGTSIAASSSTELSYTAAGGKNGWHDLSILCIIDETLGGEAKGQAQKITHHHFSLDGQTLT